MGFDLTHQNGFGWLIRDNWRGRIVYPLYQTSGDRLKEFAVRATKIPSFPTDRSTTQTTLSLHQTFSSLRFRLLGIFQMESMMVDEGILLRGILPGSREIWEKEVDQPQQQPKSIFYSKKGSVYIFIEIDIYPLSASAAVSIYLNLYLVTGIRSTSPLNLRSEMWNI